MQVIRPAVNLAVGSMRVCISDTIVCMELASEVEIRAVRSLARFRGLPELPWLTVVSTDHDSGVLL